MWFAGPVIVSGTAILRAAHHPERQSMARFRIGCPAFAGGYRQIGSGFAGTGNGGSLVGGGDSGSGAGSAAGCGAFAGCGGVVGGRPRPVVRCGFFAVGRPSA
jgi:hypothetical protein